MFESVVCEKPAILSRPQWVNQSYQSHDLIRTCCVITPQKHWRCIILSNILPPKFDLSWTLRMVSLNCAEWMGWAVESVDVSQAAACNFIITYIDDLVQGKRCSIASKFSCSSINTLRPRQNGHRFADYTFKRIFLNENVRISIKISLKLVPKGPINNNPALVQIMVGRRSGDKPLSEPMVVSVLTHICVTRPQWFKVITKATSKITSAQIWQFHVVFHNWI